MNAQANLAAVDTNIIDKLGLLKAQQAEIKEQIDSLKAVLEAQGFEEGEGDLYRATLSESEHKTVNWQAIAKHYQPKIDPRTLAKYTKTTTSTTLRVTARVGVAA